MSYSHDTSSLSSLNIKNNKRKIMNKKIVFKQNPVIRGHFKNAEDNALTLLSDFDIDVLNTIYYITQQSLFNIHPIEYTDIKIRTKTFFISELRKQLKMSSHTYIDDIKKSLKNLFNVEIYLKNFIDPISGKKIKEQYSRIITDIKYIDSKQNEVIIEFSDLFMVNILRHTDKQSDKKIGNFTPIDTETTRKLKSKYAKRLYEHLLSFRGKGQRNYITLDIEQLNKLYGTNHTSLSRLTEITKRIYIKVNEKLSFTYEAYKADKKICFKFDI